jgi:hypothetical protein
MWYGAKAQIFLHVMFETNVSNTTITSMRRMRIIEVISDKPDLDIICTYMRSSSQNTYVKQIIIIAVVGL